MHFNYPIIRFKKVNYGNVIASPLPLKHYKCYCTFNITYQTLSTGQRCEGSYCNFSDEMWDWYTFCS